MRKKFIFCMLFAVIVNFSYGQSTATNSGGQVVTVQPKIIVVPFVKEGVDVRQLIENDDNVKIVLSKVKEAFDTRGFTTVDFIAKYKAMSSNAAINARANNQSNYMTEVVQGSGADIKIEVTLILPPDNGTGTSVRLILQAYEVSTGNSLSNKSCDSPKKYTNDIGKLATMALEPIMEDFLNVMQSKFNDIVNNGQSVIIDISVAENSKINLSTTFSGLPLSDLLEQWMEKNAFKNNYHIQGTEDLSMIFDDVKIPLKDQSTGKNYNPNKFALELFTYIQSLGITPKKSGKSNTILITLN